MSAVTCVARGFTDDGGVVVVVLHPQWRHHDGTNSWLARLGLRGHACNTGLAVLIAASYEAAFQEGTVAVARGICGRRAVHRVTATLLLVI